MEGHGTVEPLNKGTISNNQYSPTKNLKLKMRKMEKLGQETKEPANKESNSNNQYSPTKTQREISKKGAINLPEVNKKITHETTNNQLEDDTHYNVEEKKQELNPINIKNQSNKNTEENKIQKKKVDQNQKLNYTINRTIWKQKTRIR